MKKNNLKRIGLYGGSFDPIHCGHLLVARAALEELELDRLFFIPAAQSPFKPDSEPTDAVQRTRLIRLALAGCTDCEVDLQEINRGGVSYAIDTVRSYSETHPGTEVFYLIGDDHVEKLPQWKDAAQLARLVSIAIIPRPGSAGHELPEPFRGRRLAGWPIELSSSDIRGRIQSGKSVAHLLPPAVSEAIANNRLYL